LYTFSLVRYIFTVTKIYLRPLQSLPIQNTKNEEESLQFYTYAPNFHPVLERTETSFFPVYFYKNGIKLGSFGTIEVNKEHEQIILTIYMVVCDVYRSSRVFMSF
jgi:hypothetical protein